MQIKILLYEDNAHLRQSLRTLLEYEADVELLAALPDAQQIQADIAALRPDVVLMDIDMPVVNGIDALHKLREKYPDLPVIMLTIFEDNEHIFDAICAGANGYLLKKQFDQLVPAIRDVLNGGAPMTSSVARKVLGFFPRRKAATADMDALTTREQELLQWLVKGYSYKMIADKMDISLETVRTYIKKIYRKLQVNSATEAAYKAMQDKLI
jgi:DNA-binding NarL/FixJ family response regulator